MAQRVTISGWRCRLEWHGCSWGMWGIPLVNTSCSDDHHTLISPCPSSSPLIIIMVGYSLPMLPLLLLLLLVSSDRSEQVGLLLFTWGIAWYIIHSDTPQWANRACSDTTVQWLSNVNNLKERGLFFGLLLVLWEHSLTDRIISGWGREIYFSSWLNRAAFACFSAWHLPPWFLYMSPPRPRPSLGLNESHFKRQLRAFR